MREIGIRTWSGIAAGLLLCGASGAAAQTGSPPAMVPLARDCAAPGTDDIVVCAGREPNSPYRLPPQPDGFDPFGTVESVSRERNRLIDVGAEGTGSCSTVGVGGWTGCGAIAFKQRIEQQADAERNREPWRVSVRAGPMRPAGEPR
ncbi:MAG: hypothetical protein ACK4K7_04315 [Allosphingosinicella sp.]|uniref:hypothetical protein n=1 Tax=Allosphingosinicella sp. TaxID=2823234 RepID=UPI003930B41A